MKKFFKPVLMVLLTISIASCATNLSKPAGPREPSKVKFSKFKAVQMKEIEIAPKFAEHPANQKAAKKVEDILFERMNSSFRGLKRIEKGDDFKKSSKRTLQITPVVKEVKFIGGGARFFAGALAGSSAILMEVTYTDSSTGKVIAKPEFYSQGNAYAGAYTFGTTDNLMLERIANLIHQYSVDNK